MINTDGSLEVEDLLRITCASDPAISSDGTLAAYVTSRAAVGADRMETRIWLVPTDGMSPARPITAGPDDTSPRFAPDGRVIMFRRAVDGVTQLFILPVDAGEARQVTSREQVPGGISEPVFSPDGSRIAFVAPVDATGHEAGAPLVVDHLNYKVDGQGIIGNNRQHVHVVDIETGAVRRLTEGDWHASSPAWSPDGSRIAFAAGGHIDAPPHTSVVQVVDVDDDRAQPRTVGEATAVGGPVCWSPDGTSLLGVGRHRPLPSISYLVEQDVDSDGTRLLAEDLDRNVMPGATAYPGGSPAYAADGAAVVFCIRDGGETQLCRTERLTGEVRRFRLAERQVVSGLAVASEVDRAVVVLADPSTYGEVVVVDLVTGESKPLTRHQEGDLPDLSVLVAEEREFTISDGWTVHGWLLRHPDTAGPSPLLLDIHGGPHNAWTGAADAAHLYHQVLAARGWSVLTLNPRGSDGYGNDFYAAVVGSWGVADERDFLEPIDTLVAEGTADRGRLAVTGYSYGGFSTCHLTSRTDRFVAAVAGGLVCDLPAMAASSDYGQFMADIEFSVDRAELRELSPLIHAATVVTPTLILHGADDVRCPVEQAEHWFEALQRQGVPSQLVTYPDSSHLFIMAGRPGLRVDYNRRVIEWLERWMHPDSVEETEQSLSN